MDLGVTGGQTAARAALDKTAVALCLAQLFTPLLLQPPLVSGSVESRGRFLRQFSALLLIDLCLRWVRLGRPLVPACKC